MQQIGRRVFGSQWTGDEGASAFGQHPFHPDDQNALFNHERFTTITNLIVDALAKGRLVCALRTEQGGEPFVPVGAGVWNTEHYDDWFKTCCMKQVKFDELVTTKYETKRWIFIRKKELDQFRIPD